ncbi:MAG TPA: hypothetical protein VGF69_12355 [Thermoanaerobaculia bacterium]|jgi:hypothetical protein
MTQTCPNCGSDRVRRGGRRLWTIYLVLIAAAIPAVLILKLNAAIIGGIMLAVIVLANLVFNERICAECGQQV